MILPRRILLIAIFLILSGFQLQPFQTDLIGEVLESQSCEDVDEGSDHVDDLRDILFPLVVIEEYVHYWGADT